MIGSKKKRNDKGYEAESGELRAKSGELRAESGELRAES